VYAYDPGYLSPPFFSFKSARIIILYHLLLYIFFSFFLLFVLTLFSCPSCFLGVSVRKRSIEILKDRCILPQKPAQYVDICVAILSVVHDREESVRKLVLDTFESLWFSNDSKQSTDDPTDVVQTIVKVVCKLDTPEPFVEVCFRFIYFAVASDGGHNIHTHNKHTHTHTHPHTHTHTHTHTHAQNAMSLACRY